jgi:hypothetical protein
LLFLTEQTECQAQVHCLTPGRIIAFSAPVKETYFGTVSYHLKSIIPDELTKGERDPEARIFKESQYVLDAGSYPHRRAWPG